ncbi:MAG: hypothetical protein M3P37_05710 [Actinomycetota bacterium]|nr:hypothetical protein [Actinomycetota bacterium]
MLHLLGEGGLARAPEGEVRLLSGPEGMRVLPSGLRARLRAELEDALQGGTPLAATFVEDVPVSFCYVAFETEGLWDVAMDTLDGHRRRRVCCAVRRFYDPPHARDERQGAGLGALETNAASMNLAGLLGFVPRGSLLRPRIGREAITAGPGRVVTGYAPPAGTTW